MERIKKLMETGTPMKWLFTGDSITHGALHTFGRRDYVQIFEERVRYELGRSRDIVIKTAISGWNTKSILDDIEWNILQFRPDVVSIMIGMNDAALEDYDERIFARNYHSIIDIVWECTGAEIILHTPNPIVLGIHPYRDKNIHTVPGVVKQVAKERGLSVVDHWTEWQEAWEEQPIRSYAWMNDNIHPNEFGHLAFARALFKELGIWDKKSMCCGDKLP